jgi:peptidoglycan/LPS O-acetylase OafA/YrhL
MGAPPPIRIDVLDRLRSLVILLVLLHHSLIPYATHGLVFWWIADTGGVKWFDLLLLLDDTFMMPTLFFVAGYLLPSSWDRNAAAFFAGKARRLVLPLAVGVLFLGPIIAFCRVLDSGGTGQSFWTFWIYRYLPRNREQFHFWFLGVLFVFVSLAWLGRRWSWDGFGRAPFFVRQLRAFGLAPLYLYSALLGLFVVLVSRQFDFNEWVNLGGILQFQPTRLPIYAGFFILGLAARGAGWQPQAASLPPRSVALALALVLCLTLVALRAGLLLPESGLGPALGNFLFPLVAMSLFVLALRAALALGRVRWRTGLDRRSYGIYLVHLPIVITLQYLLIALPLGPWSKAALVAAVAGLLSYALASLLVLLPGTRSIV